ncbi:signal recognition particle protein Srp54 [Candidatus Woesearchaeota archaeon]|nr:signal recognition particle protein Srp54 [Candidatus Woesearchaeota archaeon]
MVLEKLGNSLKDTLSKIGKAVFVDEKLVNSLVKDIQRALLQSDVNVKMVFELTNKIKHRILKEDTPPGLTKKEYLIKIVYEELVNFLGEKESTIEIKKKPTKIMLVGLFGHGKTTTTAKLAKYYQKRGHKVAVMSTDTWRPAAYEQLRQLGAQINVPVYGNPKAKHPVDIYKQFEPELKGFDVVIIDTAGRDALSDELVEELNAIHKAVQADEKLLVIGGDVGQAAERQAKTFHDTVDVTGVVITKLEGTAKGGGALIACSVTGAKVKFIGVGEKVDDLEVYSPERFVGKMLGMGDLEGLLEKAREAITEEDAQDMGKKLLKGDFNLIDLYDQMQAMKKMGPLSKVMEMIPGMGGMKIPKDALQVQEEKLRKWKFILDSCTKEELEDPEKVINAARVDRIAKGAGMPTSEVRELLKQYKQSKKLMKSMKGMGGGSPQQMEKMMKRMGGGKGMPGMPGMGKKMRMK